MGGGVAVHGTLGRRLLLLALIAAAACSGERRSEGPNQSPMEQLRSLQPHLAAAPTASDGLRYQAVPGTGTIGEFLQGVFKSVNGFWRASFSLANRPYPEVEMVSVPAPFATDSNCGPVDQGAGAFYCPGEARGSPIHSTDRVYAPVGWTYEAVYEPSPEHGELAVAFVVAHEVAYHVQHAAGIIDAATPAFCCNLSAVTVELHADCLTGVWAHYAYGPDRLGERLIGEVIARANAAADLGRLFAPARDARSSIDERTRSFAVGYGQGEIQRCEQHALAPA